MCLGEGAYILRTGYRQVRMPIPRLDLTEIALQNRFPPVQEDKIPAIFLHRRHLMAGHHDGLSRGDQLADHAFEHIGIDRVKAAERLVQEDQLGVVQDGRDQLDLLLVALGELFGEIAAVFGDPEPLEPAVGRRRRLPRGHAAQLAEIHELLVHFDLGIDSPFLRHIAKADRIPAKRPAVPGDVPLVPGQHPQNHADGGGFSSPIGTDQAENAGLVDRKTDGIDRFAFSKRLAHALYGQSHGLPSLLRRLTSSIPGGRLFVKNLTSFFLRPPACKIQWMSK